MVRVLVDNCFKMFIVEIAALLSAIKRIFSPLILEVTIGTVIGVVIRPA